jgi:hypothetical protein
VLQIADVRVHHWRAKLAATGALEDLPPDGNPVHRILPWEEEAILDVIEQWGEVDRSHRKLAYRGSYIGKVFVAPPRFCGWRSSTASCYPASGRARRSTTCTRESRTRH